MLIHSIESMAALDGEGVRYALFLAGCPLRCVCCHNPDTWTAKSGQEVSCETLLKKILRCAPYFGDRGGVTFSGGEPLLQPEEIVRLGSMLRDHQIGYALDTSGCVPLSQSVKEAVKGAEMVICDLKYPDNVSMEKFTKGNLDQVKTFLDFLRQIHMRTWIRTVMIPGINDDFSWVDRYLETLAPYEEIVEKYELLAFHTMGFFKYEQAGIENPLKNTPPLSHERLTVLQKYADEHRYKQ